MEFESRRRIEEEIMKLLSDDNTCMIAICGAGGVGKTTLVHRITDRVREEKLFDEVVLIVVSQQIDLPRIQKEIAECLRLEFIEDTLDCRARKLYVRLLDSKRKLIIFDDVWDCFKLEDIGVPFVNCSTRCKIILTSRVKDACEQMSAEKIISMEVLTKDEAWTLFKEKAGSCVERTDLRHIVEEVVAECKGLPLALVTVGIALKDRNMHVWKDSLSQLRRSFPIDFPEVLKLVYKPIKLSYDFLENESVKSFFLLCCLFPEDCDIPIEDLTLYGIGLDMFEGISNIEEGRNRTHTFIEKLMSRFLLLKSDEEDCVKMHDVVRDVAIYIGSKEMNGFLKSMTMSSMDSSRNCNWMSIDISMQNSKFPVGSDFSKLRLMIILGSTSYHAPSEGFKGMKVLNVLSISGRNLGSFSPTLGLLKKLTTLHLRQCAVKDISVFGELVSLEILCIHWCYNIEELPADIGRLNRLRLFKLINCPRLKRIAAGVIASLVGLEELAILHCSEIKWEAKGLSELGSLHNLTKLEIDGIRDINLLAEEINLSQKLVRYRILTHIRKQPLQFEREIRLCVRGDITVSSWIRQLVRTTQSLDLEGNGSNNVNLAETKGLINLKIRDCSTIKKLVNALDCKFPVLVLLELYKLLELEEIMDGTIPEGSNSFQKLESLDVRDLPKLEHLWKSQNQNVLLGNLKSLSITKCPNICYLFSAATARSLVQLQRLDIRSCNRIEHLFRNEVESNTDEEEHHITFHELMSLNLHNLPCLTTFCRGVESIKFPKLNRLKIGNLPRLNSLLHLDLEATHDHLSLHFFCNPKVEIPNLKELFLSNLPDMSKIWCRHIPMNFFHNLETLSIYKVSRISNVITSSIAKNLVNLKSLWIERCGDIVEVVEDEKEALDTYPLFPKLEYLSLLRLRRLRSFCQWKHALELRLLWNVRISDCPAMETHFGIAVYTKLINGLQKLTTS